MLAGDLQLEGRRRRSPLQVHQSAQQPARTAAGTSGRRSMPLLPYMKATFGPVYVEGELVWLTGKAAKYDSRQRPRPRQGRLRRLRPGEGKHGSGLLRRPVRLQLRRQRRERRRRTRPAPSARRLDPRPDLRERQPEILGGTTPDNGGANGAVFSTNKQNLMLCNVFGGFNPTPKMNIEGAISYMHGRQEAQRLTSPTNTDGKRRQGDLQDLRQPHLHGGRGVSLDRRLLQGDQPNHRSATTTS